MSKAGLVVSQWSHQKKPAARWRKKKKFTKFLSRNSSLNYDRAKVCLKDLKFSRSGCGLETLTVA